MVRAAAWLKPSGVVGFFGTCAGRRSDLLSSASACRCALSAFVRFLAIPTASHNGARSARPSGSKTHRSMSVIEILRQLTIGVRAVHKPGVAAGRCGVAEYVTAQAVSLASPVARSEAFHLGCRRGAPDPESAVRNGGHQKLDPP